MRVLDALDVADQGASHALTPRRRAYVDVVNAAGATDGVAVDDFDAEASTVR